MNIFMKKLAVFALLFVCAQIEARHESCDEHCEPKYTCSREPLPRGSWNLDVHAGVAPIVWVSRGEIDLVACSTDDTNPVFQLAKIPKFNCFYKVPWTVGGKVGYAICDNVEFNLELNYLQAKRKCGVTFNVLGLDDETFTINTKRYRLLDSYIGARYYFNRIWCNRLSFFLGGKFGLTHHFNSCAQFLANGAPLTVSSVICNTNGALCLSQNFFNKNTVVSGGLSFGLDFCFCNRWSVFVNSELVASGGPKTIPAVVFNTPTPAPLLATNFIAGSIGTELRFPVTVGFKVTF